MNKKKLNYIPFQNKTGRSVPFHLFI